MRASSVPARRGSPPPSSSTSPACPSTASRPGRRHRRQLGLRQPQRPVSLLRHPRDQHLLPADGVLGLPDAGGLPALRASRPGPRLLRGVRRPLRLPRHHHLQHHRAGRLAHRRRPLAGPGRGPRRRALRDVRRRAGRQRPPLGRPLARARISRALRRRADARPRLPLRGPAGRSRRRGRGSRQLGDGHLGRGVATRADDDVVGAPYGMGAAQVHPRQAQRPGCPAGLAAVVGDRRAARDRRGHGGQHDEVRPADAQPTSPGSPIPSSPSRSANGSPRARSRPAGHRAARRRPRRLRRRHECARPT